MGLFNLFRVCSALFLVAALSTAQANYTYDNRTGSWVPNTKTVLAPPGSSTPFRYVYRDSPSTVTSTGGFQNKTSGSFGSPPINGTSRNVPVTINGTTTKPNVNKALLSRLGKGGLAGIALGAGIDALLDGIGALIDDAGNVVRPPDPMAVDYEPPLSGYWTESSNPYPSAVAACGASLGCISAGACTPQPFSGSQWQCAKNGDPYGNIFKIGDIVCPAGSVSNGLGCIPDDSYVPVPPLDLEDAIESGYQPHPSDYPTISAEPAMAPTIVEVEPIQGLSMPPTTTTTVDLDTGKTTVIETNIWQDFNVKDNNSEQPKIEADTTTKTETYVDGQKTSESETTSSSGTATDSGSSVGSGEKLEIDIPTDCDFMPTVCAFLEWYKDDDLGEDPDLASIMKDDEEFAKTKVISFGAAVCPQPYTLHISALSMTAELSFEFFCQFAEYARALVLAAAYIFAAYISLGVARG